MGLTRFLRLVIIKITLRSKVFQHIHQGSRIWFFAVAETFGAHFHFGITFSLQGYQKKSLSVKDFF